MTIALACTACDVMTTGTVDRAGNLTATAATAQSAYDALNPKGKRRAPSAVTMTEDRHLPDSSRRQLIGGVRNLQRNSSLLQWMVNQHLNYVVSATFQSTTGDKVFDREAEALMATETRADKFDYRRMLDGEMVFRLAESHAVLDGDVALLMLDQDTGRVQGIEGDRIRSPNMGTQTDAKDWFNGVRTAAGVPVAYAIHQRTGGWSALQFEREVPVDNCHLHAYYGRFDQYRGVSPVASAYNQLQDVYEAESLSLVKTKIQGLFSMVINRGEGSQLGTLTGETDVDGNPIRSAYQVDFGGGPVVMDMDPGDDAKFLESGSPAQSLQEFWQFVTAIAMCSLDLPYALFDSSSGNFFGNKTAWLGYDRSCEIKRRRCGAMRDKCTEHKYRCLIRNKTLTLPRVAGRRLTVADKPWAWVPRKMPWWRPLEEVTAELKAIGAGLSNPYHACMEADQGDFEENVDLIAKAMKYAADAGVPLSFVIADEFLKKPV